MQRSRVSRVIRGASAASVATFAALVAHVSMDGVMPGWLGVAVPWVLSVMVCTLLAGKRLSAWRLSAAVVLSQSLFHALFTMGAALESDVMVAGHHHEMAPLALSSAGAVAPDLGMWLGHLAAAVVTVAVIHRGERTVMAVKKLSVRAVRWLAAQLGVAGAGQRVDVRPTPAPEWSLIPQGKRAGYLRVVRWRGPPVLLRF